MRQARPGAISSAALLAALAAVACPGLDPALLQSPAGADAGREQSDAGLDAEASDHGPASDQSASDREAGDGDGASPDAADAAPLDRPAGDDGAPLSDAGEPVDASTEDASRPPLRALEAALVRDFACVRDSWQRLQCWGRNNVAQLGRGTLDMSGRQPLGLVTGLSGVRALGLGDCSACAIGSGASGEGVYCWGCNESGQTGVDSAEPSVHTPALVDLSAALHAGAQQLAVSGAVACVRSGEGAVWCWGAQGGGAWPAPHLVQDLGEAVSLSGHARTVCAHDALGGVRCLADASGLSPLPGSCSATGEVYTCATAPAPDFSVSSSNLCEVVAGQVRCQGENWYGVVDPAAAGDYGQPELEPRVLAGISTAQQVRVGAQSACALLEDATLSCWGRGLYNSTGQTDGYGDDCSPAGNPGVAFCHGPAAVPGLSDVASFVYRDFAGCAVDGAGLARCWGENYGPVMRIFLQE